MKGKCKECGKEVTLVEGRRKREFCNPACRNKFYYKLSRVGVPEKKRGRPKKSQELATMDDFKPPSKIVYDGEKVDRVTFDEPPKWQPPKEENKPILKRIGEVEEELKHPPKNPLIGIKAWVKVRRDELESLRKQLK